MTTITTSSTKQARKIQAMLASLDLTATVEVKGKAKAKKARKTVDRKPVVGGAIEGKRCLTSKNRKQFIADHDWAQPGTSTVQLVKAVAEGAPLVGTWAIGPRYAEKYGVTSSPAKGKKAGKKAKATVVEAKPKATVFRRANGTVAPKAEWPIRAVLESQGLSRAEVDERTAKAMAVLA